MKIKGYENYEVRPNGEVINTKTGRVLKPVLTKKGYLHVSLCKNGKAKVFQVHRLVAEAFIPNPYNLPQVNHIDENKTNNTIDNLEWCTHEYNIQYSKSKTVLQLRMDGSLVRVWSSTHEVERQLGYRRTSISACCLGKGRSAYGFRWCYKK